METVILKTRERAERLIEYIKEKIESCGYITVEEVYRKAEIVGSKINGRFGWKDASGLEVKDTPDGYLVEFGPTEVLD